MKLLILSLSTGGGHDMRASALLNGWNDHGHEGCISRPLDDGFLAYRMGAEFYNFIQVRMPWFHQFYFRFLNTRTCTDVLPRSWALPVFSNRLETFVQILS